MKLKNLKEEKKDYYSICLLIGSFLSSIAILSPVISVRDAYSSRDLGVSVYFWSFFLKNYYELGFIISPFILFLFVVITICVIYIGYIAFFRKRRKETNKKFMGVTFTISIIMIILTYNWLVLIELIYLIQEVPSLFFLDVVYLDTYFPPGSMWWHYTNNFGVYGLLLGAFIIIIGSLYEMNRLQSWYFIPAIVITTLFIVYLFYTNLFLIL